MDKDATCKGDGTVSLYTEEEEEEKVPRVVYRNFGQSMYFCFATEEDAVALFAALQKAELVNID